MTSTHATLRRLSCLVLGLGWVLAAQAQSGELQLEPRATALKCLTSAKPGVTKPVYPAELLAAKRAAVVRVQLHFAAADQDPRVEVVSNSGDDAFAQAVRAFVAMYRLPCLQASAEPISATQEFQFVPKTPAPIVFWSPARDDGSAASRAAEEECRKSVVTPNFPEYPYNAMRRGETATVVTLLTFSRPEAPPDVAILYDGDSPAFSRAVREAVAGYRLPCASADREPVKATRVFEFRMEGGRSSALKSELTLAQFASLVKDLPSEHVRFDFATMNCPFDIKVGVFRPYMANKVGEIDETHASRREFLEWVRHVTLDIPPNAMKTLIGQEITVAVPCAVLDLL